MSVWLAKFGGTGVSNVITFFQLVLLYQVVEVETKIVTFSIVSSTKKCPIRKRKLKMIQKLASLKRAKNQK